MIQNAKAFYHKHERWVPIVFFILGFIFDTFMLRRIDELKTIIQQAVYLLVAAILIGVELIERTREIHPPRLLTKVWKYREAVLHFLLGTLLNSYTIFYFKSASALTSFIFIVVLVGLLMLNEFKHFGESQTQVHVAFWSLCLISWLVSLAPITLGFMGIVPFLLAVTTSAALFYGYYRWLSPKLISQPGLVGTALVKPFIAIQLIFVGLYFAHAIPPVPLSVTYMGIYHDIQKGDGKYDLSYTRPWWKFWQHGDQTFMARPGDTVYCFAQIFSPARFKDQIQVRWLFKDPKRGWVSADAIPLPITGGREEGYRGITKKTNYQPGEWRVQVETLDEREVGRIHFDIEADTSTDPRESRIDAK
jgi:Protein of unknown function (DUF2914)